MRRARRRSRIGGPFGPDPRIGDGREEAHDRMDRPARKYLGVERFDWIMPGEQRVALIVRPVKVRHIVGVVRFRPGGPVPGH
ncbi:hypothetical protein [Streptomyces atroolivaceus]|uniref:hypothetical protein n=1 Tax=Streptomyces atroolivaceus TaxID=66869 RepID=UPI0037A81FF6